MSQVRKPTFSVSPRDCVFSDAHVSSNVFIQGKQMINPSGLLRLSTGEWCRSCRACRVVPAPRPGTDAAIGPARHFPARLVVPGLDLVPPFGHKAVHSRGMVHVGRE
jgi:hypothetical protein